MIARSVGRILETDAVDQQERGAPNAHSAQ